MPRIRQPARGASFVAHPVDDVVPIRSAKRAAAV